MMNRSPESPLSALVLPPDTSAPAWKNELADHRLRLSTLQAEAEELGSRHRADAFRRLALMIDVWECLADDSPERAREVSAFCAEAFERLAAEGDAGEKHASAWALRESSARWDDYLRLIDSDADADAGFGLSAPVSARDQDDAPSAIDAGALFRMLTGDSSPPGDPFAAEPIASGLFSLTRVAGVGTPPPEGDSAADGPGFRGRSTDPGHPEGVGESSESIVTPAVEAEPFEFPPSPSTLAIDQDMRETFLAEASDLFDRVETLVLSLGRGQRSTETLHELGRCFHTLKGAAGSVGLFQLTALVHAMEEKLEEAAGEATDALIDLLHGLLHYLEGVFIALRRSGPPTAARPAPNPTTEIVTCVVRPGRNAPVLSARESPAPPAPDVTGPIPGSDSRPVPPPPSLSPDGPGVEGLVRVSSERIDELMDLASELIIRRGLWAAQAETMKDLAAQARTSRNRLMNTIDRLRDLRPSRASAPTSAGAYDHRTDVPEMIRRLVEQADDLVVLTDSAQATATPLSDNSDALARLSLQLWESLQAIRIVPVRGLFQRLARVAHEAARVEGRHVEVAMIGEETGVDRAVQDKAFEPLLHVVRNAVCHGIESAEDRRNAGKPAIGRVTLEASRTGNTLVLSVRDDGRGLDYAAIAAKGRRLGLIGADDSPTLERLNALIFQGGFSTRDSANAIAGRGVGMDVVSQEVGRLHGTIALGSRPGEGTTLSVSLPARLALQQAMVMRVDGQAFALPVELIDLVQPFDPAVDEPAGPHPLARVRDQWVPMTSAREALGLPPASAASCPKLLLIRADGGPLAVLADTIDGTSELVVKPLGPLLAGHPLISGTSLSVTGEVIFALNPAGLAHWPHEGQGRGGPAAPESPPVKRNAPILVVDDSISVRKVVARHLRALGHEVEEVSDGLEALGKIRNRTYALVLSDLEMPRMDGFELLAELNRLRLASAVPVVIASTRSDPETRRRVLGLGARKFIPKPIEPDVLAEIARDLIPVHAEAPEGLL